MIKEMTYKVTFEEVITALKRDALDFAADKEIGAETNKDLKYVAGRFLKKFGHDLEITDADIEYWKTTPASDVVIDYSPFLNN